MDLKRGPPPPQHNGTGSRRGYRGGGGVLSDQMAPREALGRVPPGPGRWSAAWRRAVTAPMLDPST